MRNKVLMNKNEKRRRIEEAALRLFAKEDFNRISIDQIVQDAHVAKGTFYLYFHDKVQLINHLIVKKSSSIIDEALMKAKEEQIDDKIEELIFLILELVSTVCYSSIVLKQPDSIDNLKPMLYTTIRKMIKRS